MIEIGAKIKKYRLRKGISQLDLEMEINASPGCISRFENCKVNPTKETLCKLAAALDLSQDEYADLLGIKVYSSVNLMAAITQLSNCTSLQDILQESVELMFDICDDFNGGMILLEKDNKLKVEAISKRPEILSVLKILPTNPFKLSINIKKESNLLVRSYVDDKVYQSTDFTKFTKEVISDQLARIIGQRLNYSNGMSIPLSFDGNKLGVCLLSKSSCEDFTQYEIETWRLISQQIGYSIYQLQEYFNFEK